MSASDPRQARGQDDGGDHWIDRWSISGRMILAAGLPLLLLLVGATVVTLQVNGLEELHAEDAQERRELRSTIELQSAFSGVVEASQTYVMTGDAQNRSRLESRISTMESRLEAYEDPLEEPQRQGAFASVRENASAYLEIARQAQSHVEEDEDEQARQLLTSARASEARQDAEANIEQLRSAQERDVEERQQAMGEAQDALDRGLVLGSLGALLAVGIVTYDVTDRTRSRLGRLADSLGDRLDELRGLHADQQERLDSQTAGIDATETRLNALQSACEAIDDRLSNAVQMADEIEDAAESGNARLDATLSSLDETDANVSTVAERVLDIGEELQQLEDVAQEVASIADQIDMLALNASVEASRARGESHGLDEIRDLAERSQERGQRIQTILESAREESDAAAIALETSGKAVEETRTRALETTDAFSNVESCLEAGLEEMQDIERLAGEQNAAIGDAKKELAGTHGDAEEVERNRERADELAADLEDIARRLREVS